MTHTPQTPDTALARYADFFDGLSTRDLDTINSLFAPDVHYQNPFSDVRGRAQVRVLFNKMFKQCADLQIKVFDTALNDKAGYIHWHMAFRPRSRWLGKYRCHIDGVSRVQFDEANQISVQHDYWDASVIHERLPLVGSLVRLVKYAAR